MFMSEQNLNVTSSVESNLSRNPRNFQFNGYQIQWVVDSPLRGDMFPLIITNSIPVNVTVETTWGAVQHFSFDSLRLDQVNVAWVKLPESPQGIGSVLVSVNDEDSGSYDLDWVKLPKIINVPTKIYYSYKWHSVWSGTTLLEIHLWDNGTIQVINRNNTGKDIPLYNSSFDFVQSNSITNWMELWLPIDFSEAHKWESWKYHMPVATCDGGGFKERWEPYWGESTQYSISFTKVVDKDTCSGGRTLHSHPEISQFFKLILNATQEIITAQFNPKTDQITTETSTVSEFPWALRLELLIPILLGLSILLRRTKYRKLN